MNSEFIMNSMIVSTYRRKEGTTSSYYFQHGIKILPNRIGIFKGELSKVKKKGRNLLHPIVGQLKANFNKNEESALKQFSPFRIHTQIWQHEYFPQFIGYGTCGISGKDGKITENSDTGDLLIFYSSDMEWEEIDVFYFQGMGKNPDDLEETMKYASDIVDKNQKGMRQN